MSDIYLLCVKALVKMGIDASSIDKNGLEAAIEQAKGVAPSLKRLIGKPNFDAEMHNFFSKSGEFKTAINNMAKHKNASVSVAAGKARATGNHLA
jgi:hypothetical protein